MQDGGDDGLTLKRGHRDVPSTRNHLTFDRRFREMTGSSPLQWLLHQRVLRAQQILSTTDLDIDAVVRPVDSPTMWRCGHTSGESWGYRPQSYRASFRTA